MLFKNCARICELKARHGVDLGITYKNKDACKRFIAEAKRQQLADTLANADFFLAAYGITDESCCDNELVLAD